MCGFWHSRSHVIMCRRWPVYDEAAVPALHEALEEVGARYTQIQAGPQAGQRHRRFRCRPGV